MQYRPKPAAHWRGAERELEAERPQLRRQQLGQYRQRNHQLATFEDGTSNTAIFSEWIKGQGVPTGSSKNGLLEVYNLGQNSNFYATDFLFMQLCNTVPITNANQQWQWKGEWWAYGGTMIYSHTQTPNRTSCVYHDINQDGSWNHHDGLGQFQPPRRRERAVHGRLGPVHQEQRELPVLVRHCDPELW